MPTRPSDPACTSCEAPRPTSGWPSALEVGPSAGSSTRELVLQEVPGGFEVHALLSVDPGRRVYRITRTGIDRTTPLELIAIPESVDASLPQSSLLASLNSRVGARAPSLQRIFAAGRLDNDRVYAVVEPQLGTPLVETISTGPLPLGRTLHLAHVLAGFLSGLWDAGLTAGPLTPSRVNVLPQWNGSDEVQVQSTWFLGPEGAGYDLSPFAPPEWRTGGNSRECDVYSLGAVLVRALTGRPAYSRRDRARALREGQPPHWVDLVCEDGTPAPPKLNTLLRQMLSYDPGARPLDMHTVQDELYGLTLTSIRPSIAPPMLFEDLSDHPEDTDSFEDADTAITESDQATPLPVATYPVPAALPPEPLPPSEPDIMDEEPVEERRPMLWFGLAFGVTAAIALLVLGGTILYSGASADGTAETTAVDEAPGLEAPEPPDPGGAMTAAEPTPPEDMDTAPDTDLDPVEEVVEPPPPPARRRATRRARRPVQPPEVETPTGTTTDAGQAKPDTDAPAAGTGDAEAPATDPKAGTTPSGSDLRNPFGR